MGEYLWSYDRMKLKNQVQKNLFFLSKCKFKVGLRQKWMIPSCSPWKVVTFFGKDHVNWSSTNWVMIGRRWNIKFGKFKFGVTKKIIDFSKHDFSTSSYHNSTNIGPIGMFFTKNKHYFSPAFQICQERCNFFINYMRK